ncbi:MAG: hypothetical protein R2822_23255 [Spirosomataceae bacterium]
MTIFHDKKKRFATVKIIDKAGIIRSETNFKDELKHGFEKVFYTDGSLYWKSDYRNDVANGTFMVYYPDGSLKRKEKYRNGYKKEGFCYDTLGNISAYYPLFEQTLFLAKERIPYNDILGKNGLLLSKELIWDGP